MTLHSLWILGILAVAGSAGAVLRYLIDESITVRQARRNPSRKHFFPWGIFTANSLACFLMAAALAVAARNGVLLELNLLFEAPPGAIDSGRMTSVLFLAFTIGLCGSLSTMSTLMVSVVSLLRAGARALAVTYLGFSLLAGLGAGALGYYSVSLFLGH